MKFIKIGLIALVLSFVFVQVAFAQDNDLPQTAVEALDLLAVTLAGFAALVSSAVTNWIKSKPWLSDKQKEDISGAAAQLIAVVSSSAIGFVVAYLSPLAAELDERGIYAAILAVVTVLLSEFVFELKGFRKAIAARVG